jgi:predicted DNA-binding transcriptional regulator YafY
VALDEQYRTTLTGLNTLEVQSLFVASNNRALRDVGLEGAAERLLMKLQAALPTAHHSTADHIRQRLMIDPTWWWHDSTTPQFWDNLQRAVYDDRLIDVAYENSNGEVARRILAPYSLICKSSLWYLLAAREDSPDEALHTYRVTRFHSVNVLDRPFVRRPDFDLPAYWESQLKSFTDTFSDYRCTIRVHPQRVPFVKWLMPGRWEVVETNGDGWATLHLMMDSDLLAKMLVFGLTGYVEVIDPIDLARSVLEMAQTVVAHLGPNVRV